MRKLKRSLPLYPTQMVNLFEGMENLMMLLRRVPVSKIKTVRTLSDESPASTSCACVRYLSSVVFVCDSHARVYKLKCLDCSVESNLPYSFENQRKFKMGYIAYILNNAFKLSRDISWLMLGFPSSE